jgi:hypothetical protein
MTPVTKDQFCWLDYLATSNQSAARVKADRGAQLHAAGVHAAIVRRVAPTVRQPAALFATKGFRSS